MGQDEGDSDRLVRARLRVNGFVDRPRRLIGVGESVHEVQQFMEFRFALLEELVRRHRATTLILESGLSEAIAVDEYVRGRTDSVDFASQLGPDYNR